MNEADQIQRLYDTGLKDPALIAKAMTMSELDVHRILYERSAEYRQSLNAKTSNAPADTAEEMLSIMADIARTAQNPFCKLSAARVVRDDLKGRRDAAPVDQGLNADVIKLLSERTAMLRRNRQRFLTNAAGPATVDI